MKKHLQALDKIASVLKSHELMDATVEAQIDGLKAKIKQIPEVPELSGALSAPSELKNLPQGLALFTDGACRGNPGPGSWACVAQTHDGTIIFESCGHESLTTNNKMEIQAVIGAYHQLEQYLLDNPFAQHTDILLFTDSKYVVDGMNQWVPGWKARDWKKADGKPPENLSLWQELDSLKNRFLQVKVGWVKGHNGHPQNEYCDRLANRLLDDEGF
ncbi:MAG: ribonuclease HI [Bacteriovoracaceae bacterium]|nr:ribonuclease HI [Bacteriovoracaceae bacterium]